MGDRVSVEIQGLDELERALDQVRKGVERGAASTVKAESDATANDMRGNAPVDTGELKGSVSARSAGTDAEVEVSARHAGFVNYGTSTHAAQPFATTAAEMARKRMPKRAADTIKGQLP